MTAQRPDLLPFALPARLGLPYHGAVRDGVLALPGGGTKVHSQPDSGAAVLVQHPLAAIPTLTDAEQAHATANGHQWVNYAYLSGTNRDIGGNSLGKDRWLYCDATSTWVIRVEYTGASIYVPGSIDVYLERRFGFFDGAEQADPLIDRLLASYAPTRIAVAQATFRPKFHSKTGAVSVINLMLPYNDLVSQPLYLASGRTYGTGFGGFYECYEAVKLVIGGNGSTDEATKGNGISAAFTLLHTDEDAYSTSTVGDPTTEASVPCCGGYVAEGDCPSSCSAADDGTQTTSYDNWVMDFCDSGGVVKSVSIHYQQTKNWWWDITTTCTFLPDPLNPGYGTCPVDDSVVNYGSLFSYSRTISIGSQTIAQTGTTEFENGALVSSDAWWVNHYGLTDPDLYWGYVKISEDMLFEVKTTSASPGNVVVISPEGSSYTDADFGHWSYDIAKSQWHADDSSTLVCAV